MKNPQNMRRMAALFTLVLALPVVAEEQSVSRNKDYMGTLPASAKTIKLARSVEASQKADSAAAATHNRAEESPSSMPYVTYDGAATADR